MRKKSVLPFATTWMDLAHLMLSEIDKPDRERKHSTLSLTCEIRTGQTYETNKQTKTKMEVNGGSLGIGVGG